MIRSRHTKVAGLVAVVVAASAAVAGATIAVGDGGPAEGQPHPKQVTMPAAAQTFPAHVAEAFAKAPVAPVPDSLVSLSSKLAGANPKAARLARKGPGDSSVYVLPATDGFCLASSSGVEAGCYDGVDLSPSSVICAPGLPPDSVEVFGVAPGGVSEVVVSLADSSTRTIDVEGSVFIYRASKDAPQPLEVSWVAADGTRGRAPAGVPADFREDRCATPGDAPAAPAAAPKAGSESSPPVVVTTVPTP